MQNLLAATYAAISKYRLLTPRWTRDVIKLKQHTWVDIFRLWLRKGSHVVHPWGCMDLTLMQKMRFFYSQLFPSHGWPQELMIIMMTTKKNMMSTTMRTTMMMTMMNARYGITGLWHIWHPCKSNNVKLCILFTSTFTPVKVGQQQVFWQVLLVRFQANFGFLCIAGCST